jgi:hypothetical protein
MEYVHLFLTLDDKKMCEYWTCEQQPATFLYPKPDLSLPGILIPIPKDSGVGTEH